MYERIRQRDADKACPQKPDHDLVDRERAASHRAPQQDRRSQHVCREYDGRYRLCQGGCHHHKQHRQTEMLPQGGQIAQRETRKSPFGSIRCQLEELVERRNRIGDELPQGEIIEVLEHHPQVADREPYDGGPILGKFQRFQLRRRTLAASVQLRDERQLLLETVIGDGFANGRRDQIVAVKRLRVSPASHLQRWLQPVIDAGD